MVTNIRYVAKGNDLIKYSIDGVEKSITFDMLRKIWFTKNKETKIIESVINEDTLEDGIAYAYGDNLIGFTAIIASGQGGILVFYDSKSNEFVHYSSANFCVDFVRYKNKIILLNYVWYYGMPYHLETSYVTFGVKNISDYGAKGCCDIPIDFQPSQTGEYNLKIEDEKLIIIIDKKNYVYADDIDVYFSQKPKKENVWLYETRSIIDCLDKIEYIKGKML